MQQSSRRVIWNRGGKRRSARARGAFEAVNVEEGSKVTKGEVLAYLEHADMDAALAGSKAELAKTRGTRRATGDGRSNEARIRSQ